MGFLLAFHGPTAAVVLCALLFTEEAGVPLPVAPGDLVLLAAGLLIATGALSPWVFLPLAVLAATGGAVVGYTWTRRVGAAGLRALSRRLPLARHLDRLSGRLESAGPAGIAICRLLPGLRVNTTLVSGSIGLEIRTFVLGVVPAVIVWVASFTALGALAGMPAVHALARVDQLALRAALVLMVAGIAYLAARHLPARRHGAHSAALASTPPRIVLAVVIDLMAIGSAVTLLDLVARAMIGVGRIDGWIDALAATIISILAYLVLARSGVGVTAGEALCRVTYRPNCGQLAPHQPRSGSLRSP